jgi:histidyl-tRNA synthetase
MRYQAPRGTEDLLPDSAQTWRRAETTFLELAKSFGYGEVRTPVFEDTDLFVRSAGETSDVVSKQMYTFLDKGERSLTLKPEGTAGVIRAVIERRLLGQGQPLRLAYITPIFRYERPQKGRLRAAHQLGLELIGSASMLADLEVIELTVRFYRAMGVSDAKVLLNSIGREACRAAYRAEVLRVAAPYLQDQDMEVREKVERNPLRLLDSKDPEVKAALVDLKPITEFLEPESRERFDGLQKALDSAGIEVELRPDVVRGLDYYTETVFEIHSEKLGSQSALCGGGRYDDLIAELGGPSTPSVGVGMGIERLMIVLQELGLAPSEPSIEVFVVATDASMTEECLAVARWLRELGFSVTMDFDGKKLGNQLKMADKLGARFAVLIGPDELSSNTVSLRDLRDGSQQSVARDRLVEVLRG